MTSMPTFVERGELEPVIHRAIGWLEQNGLGIFWGGLERAQGFLEASWDSELVADVESFLALAKTSEVKVVFLDCTLCETAGLLEQAKGSGDSELERLAALLAPHADELVEATLCWVGGSVLYRFTLSATWADDYSEAWELAEVEPDEDDDEDAEEEGPDQAEVQRHADLLARDAKFQAAHSASQRLYAARKILEAPVVADKGLLEAIVREAKSIFEIDIKPDLDKHLVEQVQGLKDQGLTKAQIAQRLGISANRMKTMF